VAKKRTLKRAKSVARAKVAKRAGKRVQSRKRTDGKKIPIFHHVLLKTARMDDLIDWYSKVVGIEPVFQAPGIAFLSNDGANHRISVVGNPQFQSNPDFRRYTGMHHIAFEYPKVDDLLDTWERLYKEYGYEPHVAVHHGMTLSFYYVDPDGNSVELQADVFGDWKKSKKWMSTSPLFKADPIGTFVVPAQMVAARAAGVKEKELLRRAYAGEYRPTEPYDYRVDLPAP
jgi:catechol 2,3-dioxygenase